MGIHGGSRIGAGRKKGRLGARAIAEAEARQILVTEILKAWMPMIKDMIAIGLGRYRHKTKEVKPDGTIVKSSVVLPANFEYIKELVSFVVGKPKQEMASNIDIPQLEELSKNIRAIIERS